MMRVLTYNCCALPVLAGDITPRLEKIASEIISLDPDVVLFQEVFLPRHLNVLRDKLYKWRHSFSGVKAWRTFGGGLAVFSKFPLVEPAFIRFRHQGPLFRYSVLARVSRKGFISSMVHPQDGPPFHLVCTHPVADYRIWRSGDAGADAKGARSTAEYLWKRGAIARGDPYPELQRKQLAQLMVFVNGLEKDLPLVVGGDLNMTPVSKVLQNLLRSTELRDCMQGSLEPSVISERYYKLPYHQAPNKRIDYILLRKGRSGHFICKSPHYVLKKPVRVRDLNFMTLSDHFGVLVELHWSKTREKV